MGDKPVNWLWARDDDDNGPEGIEGKRPSAKNALEEDKAEEAVRASLSALGVALNNLSDARARWREAEFSEALDEVLAFRRLAEDRKAFTAAIRRHEGDGSVPLVSEEFARGVWYACDRLSGMLDYMKNWDYGVDIEQAKDEDE